MLIIAAFCPPEEVVGEVRAAIADADAAWAARGAEPEARKRWFGRSSAVATDPAASGTSIGVLHAPIIPVVRFGNLTTADARRVADALAAVAANWPPAEVHLDHVQFGTEENPRSIRAGLGGDVDALGAVARGVAGRAADLNFYLDRRLFGASLEIATAAETATAEDLAALTNSLADFRGRPWRVDRLVVLKQTFGEGTSDFVEAFSVPIGPG